MPDTNTLDKLCAVLGVPVAYLFCDDDGLAELISLYPQLQEESQVYLVNTAQQQAQDDEP